MAELEVLMELGLSEAEAKVYLQLLETGSTLVGPIIKKTGLHRATTYQVLQRLLEKGLASSAIIGKKQHFSPAEPERLFDELKEKEESLQSILPRLKARIATDKEQHVMVYLGVKGIRAALDRMLHELAQGGEYYDFGVSGLFKDIMGPFWDLWQKRKREHNILSYVIFNEEVKLKNPKLLDSYVGEMRFHPASYPSITDTMIYNDTVMLLIWTARPPIAIVIKNKDNAESYRNQFRLMWESAKT